MRLAMSIFLTYDAVTERDRESPMMTTIDRQRAIGLSSGSLWLVAAGASFCVGSLVAIGAPQARLVAAAVLLLAIALVALSVGIIRKSRRLPKPERRGQKRTMGRWLWFYAFVAIEIAALAAVNIIIAVTKHFELFVPLDLIIVGLHFLPLARLFRVRRYYMLGVLFCLIPGLTLLLLPHGSHLGRGLAVDVVPALGCGLVAALTAVAGLWEVSTAFRSASQVGTSN